MGLAFIYKIKERYKKYNSNIKTNRKEIKNMAQKLNSCITY